MHFLTCKDPYISNCRYLAREATNHHAVCGSRVCVFSKYKGVAGLGCEWIGNVHDLHSHDCRMTSPEATRKVMELIDRALTMEAACKHYADATQYPM
jgi:hypothetical protein